MNNPHDRSKNEAAYLAWEHGFNSTSKEENPYMDMQDDPQAGALSTVWQQGFNNNKKRPKPAKSKPEPIATTGYLQVEPQQAVDSTTITVSNSSIGVVDGKVMNPDMLLPGVSDYQLLQELKKRKAKELELLLKQKDLIDNQVAKLKALMEL